MHPHRSSALDGAAAALTVARTRGQVWPCHCHGLGLISRRAARERLHPRSALFSTVPVSDTLLLPTDSLFSVLAPHATATSVVS